MDKIEMDISPDKNDSSLHWMYLSVNNRIVCNIPVNAEELCNFHLKLDEYIQEQLGSKS